MKDTTTSTATTAMGDSETKISSASVKRDLDPKKNDAPAKRECAVRKSSDPALKVVLLHNDAKPPARGSKHSAGYDLSAGEAALVPRRGIAVVKTGLKIKVPYGYYGRVAPRSGLAVRRAIDTGAGVIDADYRGEVAVVLFNHSEDDFSVQVGDRIAQLVVEKISMGDVQIMDSLDDTDRGAAGFGSTGVGGQD